MLRYMAGVRWQDGRSSSEVVEIWGAEDFSVNLRQKLLRWFGHLERAEGGVLNEVEELRVEGQQLVERPKKKWSRCVTEDKNILGIEEYVYGTRLTNMEGSHRPSNPMVIGKIWTLRTKICEQNLIIKRIECLE